MNREIGSEFYQYTDVNHSNKIWANVDGDKRTFVSGRTALSAILDDILTEHNCNTAYLPSYCCYTMIEPFIRHRIAVEFYSVVFEGNSLRQNIDPAKKCDIVLLMDYFGFTSEDVLIPKCSIVIRDMTHAYFNIKPKYMSADYLFASFRKWDTIAGAAVACKTVGQWVSAPPQLPHKTFINLRNEGYRLKASYMSGKLGNKDKYLDLFKRAEELLDRDYIGYCADEVSLKRAANLAYCIQSRKDNAKVLYDGLKEIRIAEPLLPVIHDDDVPLFVPIIVKNGNRDKLKEYFINNDIYCPIHWPTSELHILSSQELELYKSELSLICDQRYGRADMMRQLDVIRGFEEKISELP